MMLTAFGIRPSDFLSLQQFVPSVWEHHEGKDLEIRWDTRKTGHPANWTSRNVTFCLEAVIDVAIKTQHAPSHPTPIDFHIVYVDVITALRDGVTMWTYKLAEGFPIETDERIDGATLAKDECLRGRVTVPFRPQGLGGLGDILGPKPTIETAEVLAFTSMFTSNEGPVLFGYFNRADFAISYEPSDNQVIRKPFPHVFEKQ